MGKTATPPAPEKPFVARKPPKAILSAEIIGVSELGAFLGVRPTTVHVWGNRGQRPPADYTINGHEAWDRETIIRWAAQTGRLPKWLKAEGATFEPEGGYKRPRRTKAEMDAARS